MLKNPTLSESDKVCYKKTNTTLGTLCSLRIDLVKVFTIGWRGLHLIFYPRLCGER